MLRYGVVLGLAITAAGLIIRFATGDPRVVTAGLTAIVTAPIATLASMVLELRLKGDLRAACLAGLTAALIIASILISLLHVS